MKVHKRVRVGKGYASLEQCNLDSAGAFDVLFELPPDADLCKRCFPPSESPVEGNPV